VNREAEAGPIGVIIVEDHADFRDLMEVLLGRQPDIKLLAQAGSLAEARAQAARFEFDVAVLDLGLPDGSRAEVIADLRRASPKVRVLILGASLDPSGIEEARSAGADEILYKLTSVDEVLATVRRLGAREPLRSLRKYRRDLELPSWTRKHPDGTWPRDIKGAKEPTALCSLRLSRTPHDLIHFSA
jgi:DNA-binding NarL/FixJ family response regulator